MPAIYKNYVLNEQDEIDRLFHMQFKDCAITISKMDSMKKAVIASKIQPKLDCLYATTERYGNPDYPKDEQIGPAEFTYIMGMIKRWETIIYWLYEIDILMEETKLDELIREAEQRLEKNNWNPELKRIRVKPVVIDGKKCKERVTVNAREDLATLYAERHARGNHTEDIMDLAKQLSNKYFK